MKCKVKARIWPIAARCSFRAVAMFEGSVPAAVPSDVGGSNASR